MAKKPMSNEKEKKLVKRATQNMGRYGKKNSKGRDSKLKRKHREY